MLQVRFRLPDIARRRKPLARTPSEIVPSTPARLAYAALNSDVALTHPRRLPVPRHCALAGDFDASAVSPWCSAHDADTGLQSRFANVMSTFAHGSLVRVSIAGVQLILVRPAGHCACSVSQSMPEILGGKAVPFAGLAMISRRAPVRAGQWHTAGRSRRAVPHR